MAGIFTGVMFNPNPKFKVGITYNNLPNELKDARFGLENIEDETITSGVSFYPDKKTVLTMDLRNLNKEEVDTSREIHTGIERTIFDRVALRGGYYRKKSTKDDVVSCGIGILPAWQKITKYTTASRNDLLSYTFILEENGTTRRWHIFSLLLRF